MNPHLARLKQVAERTYTREKRAFLILLPREGYVFFHAEAFTPNTFAANFKRLRGQEGDT